MSVIMPNLLLHKDDTGILYHNLQSCNCCPYGYHIDLDFVRYCESLVNARPSDGELLRRDKRLSRKSIEVMLGLDDIYSQWDSTKVQPVQEVPFEIEPDSPRVADKIQDYSYYTFSDSSGTTNGSPEASAFLHDALDDVVSDFERTLERTKKKEKRSSSWGHYIYAVDSCFSGNKSSVKSDVPPTQENDELEPIGDNGSNTNAHALHKIRQQMAISLSRMRDLEEQVKNIPKLQKQLATLNEEKRQLQLQLQKEEALTRKLAKDATCNKIPVTFVPQRISPVSLDSLGSRVRPTSPPEVPKRNLTRDVGVMCTQRRRDVGISVGPVMVRTVGTNPLNTKGISDNLFTKCELDELIKLAIQKFEKDFEYNRRKIKVSVGTQMVQNSKKDVRDSFAQTPPEKMVLKNSVGISAYPSQKHATVVCKPETRTVASSNDTISDIMCDKCSIIKRTVACGPDDVEAKTSISLKLMDMPPRSLSFSLGETEKLNIRRKTVGTQYQISVQSKAVQFSPSYDSIGIQNTPICLAKSCQYVSDNINRSTDTFGLVNLLDKYVNTEEEPSKTIIETRNVSCNTDEKRTRESSTSTIEPSLTSSYSNTDQIQKKDASCGDIIKPHISIACADNYCDSCKDAIKSLAKEFSKVLTSPVLGTTTDQSKIPRPKTLASPRPVRRTFVRQNTYTISTPTPSPKAEKRLLVDDSLKQLSSSLDSVSLTGGLPEKSKDGDQLSRSLHEQASISSTENSPRNKITIQSKITESTSKSVVNCKNGVEKEVPHYREYSPPVQAMFLNQLTSTSSEPRTKATPSKEMKAAMKVINDSLQKSSSKSSNLKSANAIVQKEWFRISSTDKANPLDVEDYLDCFEEISNGVLRHIVNMTDTNGNTAMHYAVSHGNFDVVSILLDSKVCNVNQTNNAGYTCVMLVSLAKLKDSSHRTVVQRLFQMADVNIRARKHCQTALMLAVSHGNLDMVEMLLAAGADINIQDEDGSSALMCAAEHGRIDIVKHLLSQPDCDSLVQDVDGSTAFKIAWQAGHREIGLLLYVHEQMLRSKMPNRSIEQRSPAVPRRQKSQQQPHTQ